MSSVPARLEDRLAEGRVLLMGVLNCTPDSFSDGGRYLDGAAARRRLDELLAEGADVVDLGAESTRPGAPSVPAAVQKERLGDLVRYAAAQGACVSIDTTSPEVAARALDDGASVVNSVSLEAAEALARVAAPRGAWLVLMHSRGGMERMTGYSVWDEGAYGDVVADVVREGSVAVERAVSAGLPRARLLFDPGLGFTKSARHSLELCARLRELEALGLPLVVGPSRKSFLALVTRPRPEAPLAPPSERLGGTIAAALHCAAHGAAILRVHDVAAVRQALDLAGALRATSAPFAPMPLPAPRSARGARA